MSEHIPPTPSDLQRELEQVRAAGTASHGPPQPPVPHILWHSIVRIFVVWLVLIIVCLAVWQFLSAR